MDSDIIFEKENVKVQGRLLRLQARGGVLVEGGYVKWDKPDKSVGFEAGAVGLRVYNGREASVVQPSSVRTKKLVAEEITLPIPAHLLDQGVETPQEARAQHRLRIVQRFINQQRGGRSEPLEPHSAFAAEGGEYMVQLVDLIGWIDQRLDVLEKAQGLETPDGFPDRTKDGHHNRAG